jgi:glutamine amidotransferase
MPDVVIIDYGMGNLFSVKQACEHVRLPAKITRNKDDILNSAAAILPGVGAFGDAMNALRKSDLVNPILDFIKTGKPFMGICLGMQLLFSESEEFGRHEGLNIIPGSVIKFTSVDDKGQVSKVPQVGWNRIQKKPIRGRDGFWDNTPLAGQNDGEFMYFVHSYYCKPADEGIALSFTNYAGIEYCSSISWRNVFACQFHPEKSASKGLDIYRNWAAILRNN